MAPPARHPSPHEIIASVFRTLSLPTPPPYSLILNYGSIPFPSSYNLTTFIASTTLLSSVLPSLILAQRNSIDPPRVKVDRFHAAAQYVSERVYVVADPLPPSGPRIGGDIESGVHFKKV